jgi:site-specific DNA-methyltransferase (adenine-specific)
LKGKIVKGDNLEVMVKIQDDYIDSCISDFPYWLEFMGKNWDKGIPYDWCLPRAKELFRITKSGGYVLIFGHPKTNHRMKCAFEDAGFNIVEEIDWIYFTGFPKNQDIGKLFDKKAGTERKVIDKKRKSPSYKTPNSNTESVNWVYGSSNMTYEQSITAPSSELAKQWDGWKTAGLKPAKEPITVFQKPLEGTYTNNIEKHGCGGMNIDACRIPTSKEDADMMNAKSSKNPTSNYSDKDEKIYGKYAENKSTPANDIGRFPPNIIFDEEAGKMLDEQTGITKSTGGSGEKSKGALGNSVYGKFDNKELSSNAGGLGDSGGGSRFFYCAKPSPSEKKLADGSKNIHVTVKPVSLIKWLIKLVTPIEGITLDITSGSGTHGVACEELNQEGYKIKWCNIEMDEDEKGESLGYIDIANKRLEKFII